MFIVDRPPPPQQFLMHSSMPTSLAPSHSPRFLTPNKVYGTDATLEMPISRHVLIIPTWRTIIRETQSFPLPKVHI